MTPFWKRAITVACLILVSACNDDPVRPEITSLTSAEAQWRATQPANNSYVIHQRVNCFCVNGGDAFEVTVIADTVVLVRKLPDFVIMPVNQYTWFRTVDQLFDEVRSALKKDGVLVNVEYNSAMGYPTVVSLDPVRNAVDDEVVYLTSNFRPAP